MNMLDYFGSMHKIWTIFQNVKSFFDFLPIFLHTFGCVEKLRPSPVHRVQIFNKNVVSSCVTIALLFVTIFFLVSLNPAVWSDEISRVAHLQKALWWSSD